MTRDRAINPMERFIKLAAIRIHLRDLPGPAIEKYLKQLRAKNQNVIWTGDFNVAPEPKDVYFGYEDSDYYLPKRMKK